MKSLHYKVCTYCNKEKPATTQYFHRQAARSDGLKSICKDCVRYDRVTYPPQPQSSEQLREAIEWMDREQAKEKRAREVQIFKARLLQAAKKANYASKGIMINGLSLDIPIRVCAKCCEQKPLTTDCFHKDKRHSSSFAVRCKECKKVLKRACNR